MSEASGLSTSKSPLVLCQPLPQYLHRPSLLSCVMDATSGKPNDSSGKATTVTKPQAAGNVRHYRLH